MSPGSALQVSPSGDVAGGLVEAKKGMIAGMAAITSEQAQNYLNRWKLVHEVEVQELRNASLDIKARQLAVLMASRDLFRDDHDREKEVDVVRERWARIRGAFRG